MSKDRFYISDPDCLATLSGAAAEDRCRSVALGVHGYENAVVVPGSVVLEYGGVFTVEGQLISESLPYKRWYVKRPVDKILADADFVDCEVLYLGAFCPVWGHLITDCLKLLWPIFKCGALPMGLRQIYITTEGRSRLPRNFFEMTQCFGVNLKLAQHIEKPTRFRRVLIPDSSFYREVDGDVLSRYYTYEFGETIERLIANSRGAHDRPFRTIMFSRSKWKGKRRRDFGCAAVESVIKRELGCEIVFPEELSFVEMVKLLGETKRLITFEDSSSHNAIFLPIGAELMLLRKSGMVNGYQFAINQLRKLKVTYIDVYAEPILTYRTMKWFGPFFVYANENLARCMGISEPPFPIMAYIHYWLVAWWYRLGRSLPWAMMRISLWCKSCR